MKTIAVLSVLFGLAVAAPAPHNGLQSLHNSEGIHPIDFNTEINGPVNSARSHLGFNNPVIVKKKTGLHVYRDSTEERADASPGDNCGKQVRVKLCDDIAGKSTDLRRSTKMENHAIHKDGVEDSIKLAKEAVESLQRDLKTIEHDKSGKSAQWKHGETDKDFHKDIESTRLALEQAQQKFSNLESMNMRAATISDARVLHDIHNARIEQERLAQWKEAMENIQRNVEIARNIEDSFKAAEHHSSFLNSEAIDTTKLMRTNTQEHNEDHKKNKETSSSLTSGRKSFEENSDKKMTTMRSEHDMISQKKAEEHVAEDMKIAASESMHLKHGHEHHMHHNTKSTQGKSAHFPLNVLNQPMALKTDANVQLTTQDKEIHVDASVRSAHSGDKMAAHDKTMTSKTNSEVTHKGAVNSEMSSRTSESIHHFSALKDESRRKNLESHNLQGSEHKIMQHGKTATKEWETNIADKTTKQEKSAWIETERQDMMMKSADSKSLKTKLDHEQENVEVIADTKASEKSAELSSEHTSHKNNAEIKNKEISAHSAMKLADNVKLATDISLNAPLHNGVQLNTDKTNHGKFAEVSKGLGIEQARVPFGHLKLGHHEHGHLEHGHIGHLEHGHDELGHHEHGHHLHGHEHGLFGHGHEHGHEHHHGHFGYHGKTAEFDSVMHPSMHMEMKELSEKSALENMLQWKHHHDAARSSYGLDAYGGGLNLAGAGGPGALGVFPHAKVGGCGIPLLLSCSPNVVSGKLAQSHGYAAPAYRNVDDSSIKNKRDIIKAKEISIKKIKDTQKSI